MLSLLIPVTPVSLLCLCLFLDGIAPTPLFPSFWFLYFLLHLKYIQKAYFPHTKKVIFFQDMGLAQIKKGTKTFLCRVLISQGRAYLPLSQLEDSLYCTMTFSLWIWWTLYLLQQYVFDDGVNLKCHLKISRLLRQFESSSHLNINIIFKDEYMMTVQMNPLCWNEK